MRERSSRPGAVLRSSHPRLVRVKSAQTEFIGGPLDGRMLPVHLNLVSVVPKVYRVPVPAHGDTPATTLVYVRAKRHDAKGRARWVYEYSEAGEPHGWRARLPFD